MKQMLTLIFVILISPSLFASTTCEGTYKTGTKVKYILSDVKGEKIQIEYFVLSRGKMEPIINNTATLVAEGKGLFGAMKNKIIERSYVLPTNDNSYAILFLIYADGTASFTARPMEGTANFLEAKCK